MTDDDAELTAVFGLWCEAKKRSEDQGCSARELSLAMKEMRELERRMAATPARDVAGIAVKLALYADMNSLRHGEVGIEQIESAYQDATRLCGRDFLSEIG